jgi:hypothetical protein
VDTRNRPAIQRTIDNEPIIQQQQLEQQQNTPSVSLELEEDQNMSTTNGFASRILEKGMKPLEQFTGAEEQDISVWIQDFEETVEAAGGDAETKRKAVVLYLSGDAKKWYRLTKVEGEEWSTFRGKLVTAFTPASQQLKTLTKLMNRKQGVNELVQSYFYDILALCSKLNPQMNEAEKLLHLLRGLKPSLAQNIIMFNPKTIQEFLELAKRSETTYIGTPSLPTTAIEESETTAAMDDESSSEQVAAISRRRNQPPQTPQSSNNHYQHRNFSRDSQASSTTLSHPTAPSSYYQSQQFNPSHQGRSTFHDSTYPIQHQTTAHNNYASRRNDYNKQPEVHYSHQYSGSSRGRCYNCGGLGHLARVCPSDRQQQYLNE